MRAPACPWPRHFRPSISKTSRSPRCPKTLPLAQTLAPPHPSTPQIAMDGEHPPGDGRGTAPPGGEDRGPRPAWIPSPLFRSLLIAPVDGPPFPPAWPIQASPVDGPGSQSRDEDLEERAKGNFWGFSQHFGIDPIVQRVKAAFGSSDSTHDDHLPNSAMYNDTFYGPSISKWDEVELQKQLGFVLEQVQAHVKALNLPAVELSDKVRSLVPRFSARPLTEEEKEVQKLVALVHNYSTDMESCIAGGVQNGQISAESAQNLYSHIHCIDQNVKLVVETSGRCFTYDGLVSKLKIPEGAKSFFDKVSSYKFALSKVLTIAECVFDNLGTCPGLFKNIGKEAGNILTEDFSFERLKLNSDPYESVSCAVGSQKGGGETIDLFMMKLKGSDKSICFSAKAFDNAKSAGNANRNAAVESEVCAAKLSIDKLYGEDLKCVIKVPFPSFDSKIELIGKKPYHAYSADISLLRRNAGEDRRYAKLNMSALYGFKSVGVGCQFSLDTEQRQLSHALGINIKKDLSAVGLTFKEGGTYKVVACKKLLDSTTTIAGQASYSREGGEDEGLKCTVGIKHSIDPEMYLKARAGTEGISVAVKKSWYAGKCTVKACAHTDFDEPWRRPKLGLMLSFRS